MTTVELAVVWGTAELREWGGFCLVVVGGLTHGSHEGTFGLTGSIGALTSPADEGTGSLEV